MEIFAMMYGELCAEFYDLDKGFAGKEELNIYQQQFSAGDFLLEPMCGTGRLLIPLQQHGYTIHGFDNAPAMLSHCKARAKMLGLAPILFEETIESFVPTQLYDGIVIPLGSFQLLYPRSKAYYALSKFSQWLKPNGKLIMDFFIPWEVLCEKTSIVAVSNRSVEIPTGGKITITNNTTVNSYEQHMFSETHYEKMVDRRVIATADEKMDILWYYPYEIELMLEKHGFNKIKRMNRFLNGSNHITVIGQMAE
jgi:SAM-dependent methyltransferase